MCNLYNFTNTNQQMATIFYLRSILRIFIPIKRSSVPLPLLHSHASFSILPNSQSVKYKYIREHESDGYIQIEK